MLRCTFALELHRVFQMTHPFQIVRGALFSHCTAMNRGSDLAAQIGFTEANRKTQVARFGGMMRNRVHSARRTAL